MDLEELRSVREQERRTDSLQHLRDSFYDDAAEYVRQLKHERSRRAEQAGDPYAAAAMRLTDEIDTAEEVIESLYERRRGKVVKLASFAAAGMPAETDGMTEQERSMFDDVVERIENNEERVLGALDGSGDDLETQVDGATDAARTVPATDTAGTTSAVDAARTSGEADTVGSPSETDALGATDETEPVGATDETEPVGAAPTPGATEEPVAHEGSATVDGAAETGEEVPEASDGSVLADAMGGPAPSGGEPGSAGGESTPSGDESKPSGGEPTPSGDESTDDVASTGQTPPATGGRASETTPEPSGDRPAAEATVATGAEGAPASGNGTDTVGGPETTPPAGETTGSPAVTDESGTGDAPTENGTATGDAAAPDADAPTADALAPDADASATGGEAPPAETDTPAVERSTVRVTDDVGEVFGVDDRAYELAASDVVHLPQMVAEPLVEQGVAEQL